MKKDYIKKGMYPYIKLEIDNLDQKDKIGVSLKRLYKYIGTYKNEGRICEYGNAYAAIRKRSQEIISRNDVRVSKREVKALVNYYGLLKNHKYIKIPYKMCFIFKAIFDITDELKADYPLTSDLETFVGQMRREVFFKTQSELFRDWYRGSVPTEKNQNLYDDIYAGDGVLTQDF